MLRGCYAPYSYMRNHLCNRVYRKRGWISICFLSDIPEIFHDYLNRKAIGSGCPAFREESTAFWLYDFNRWLGAIGVKLETSIQIHDPAPFLLPDPTILIYMNTLAAHHLPSQIRLIWQ
jgi:hypothetical protein